MHKPIQKPEKFPATNPERIFSDAPPCFEQLVTSRTCFDVVLTNIFVNSGISAPAMVPQEIIAERTHHRFGLLTEGWWARRNQLAPKVIAIETAEVIQTR